MQDDIEAKAIGTEQPKPMERQTGLSFKDINFKRAATATAVVGVTLGALGSQPEQVNASDAINPTEQNPYHLIVENPYISFEEANGIMRQAQEPTVEPGISGSGTPEPVTAAELEVIPNNDPVIGTLTDVELFGILQEHNSLDAQSKEQILRMMSELEGTRDYIAKELLANPEDALDLTKFPAQFSVLQSPDSSVYLVGHITNTEEFTDQDGKVVTPGSLLFTYADPSNPNLPGIGSFVPRPGTEVKFLMDEGEPADAIPVTAIYIDGTLVLDYVPVQGPNGKPVEEFASSVIGNPAQLENVYRFNAVPVNGELTTVLTSFIDAREATSSEAPSAQEMAFGLHNPELIGDPEFITQTQFALKDGTKINLNVYGDVQLLQDAGVLLFDFNPESQATVQAMADLYFEGLETPHVIPALSHNEHAVLNKEKNVLVEGDTIVGATANLVDLRKGIAVVLTTDATEEMYSTTGYAGPNNEYRPFDAMHVESREDGRLVIYIQIAGSDAYGNDEEKKTLVWNKVLSMPLGFLSWTFDSVQDGRDTVFELDADLYNELRNNQISMSNVIGTSTVRNKFAPLVYELVPTLSPIA